MLIRYVKDYGPHPAGREFIHPIPGVAIELIRRGIAVEVIGETPKPTSPPPPPPPKQQAPKRRG